MNEEVVTLIIRELQRNFSILEIQSKTL